MKLGKVIFVSLPSIICAGTWINYYKRRKEHVSKVLVYRRLKHIVKILSRQQHIEYQIEGKEKLTVEESYLLVPNHISLCDPLPFFMLFDDPVSFICKKEIAKMPILNDAVDLLRGYYLDRGNLREEMKTMRAVQKDMKEHNIKLVIFPEGTRSKNGDLEMNEFKPGAFKHTMALGKKIYPVCLTGTNEILDPKVHKKKIIVKVKILDPLTKEDYENMSTNEVAQLVQSRIRENLILMKA